MTQPADPTLERRLEELSTLNAIGDILNREADFEGGLSQALSKLVELLPLSSGWVFLTQVVQGDSHQGPLALAAEAGLPPALSEHDNRPLCRGSCDCQWLFRQGQLDTGVNIVHCSRLEAATGDKAGLELHASVPLLGRSGPVGILNLAATGPEPFDEETLTFLTAVGRQLGTAFERAALLAARTEAARHLATLEERQRLAAEMHDSVSQLLFAAELALQTGAAARAGELVAGAQGELRALVEVLRPADLSGGLTAALTRLAERSAGAVQVNLEVDPLDLSPINLPPAHAETLYRAAQEGVHNVLKHAHATTLWLRCRRTETGVKLVLEDDGEGLPEPLSEGFGLRSLRARAAQLGGTVRLGTRKPHGVRFELEVPLV